MRIAHFGTFDVENYGDLLFPLIVEHRLGHLGAEFVHVSPRGAPVWGDCKPSVSVDHLSSNAAGVDALLIGGGNIVHARPTALPAYQGQDICHLVAYPGLWLLPGWLAARHDLPLCWNAPGVSGRFSAKSAEYLRWVAGVSNYLSVRDTASARFLQEADIPGPIEVVPDTALDVRNLWSREELLEAYQETFADHGRTVAGQAIALHLNARYAQEDVGSLARCLDRICQKADAVGILLPLGPCHGDAEFQRRVAREMKSRPLVVGRPRSLRQVAACVACSDAYLGSSLHGLITACAFGRRCLLVGAHRMHKFAGFLQQFDLSAWLFTSWASAESNLARFFAASSECWRRVSERARPALDQHWQRIERILTGNARRSDSSSKRSRVDELIAITERQLGEQALYAGIVFDQARQVPLAFSHAPEGELEGDAALLSRWLAELRQGYDHLLASRRWRVLASLLKVANRLRGKADTPHPIEGATWTFAQYDAWLNARCKLPALEGAKELPQPAPAAVEANAGGWASTSHRKADVVVCVHNALEHVTACLASLTRCTDRRHRVILVDDGSCEDCRAFLRAFADRQANTLLVRNSTATGYTRSANLGLKISSAEYVVLLNSDTVVTPGWIERLIRCGESEARIGILGPLSNAAGWQSVPERWDLTGDWAINPLPPGGTPEMMAAMVAEVSERHYPRVPLVNGFCFAVKRAVINRIGLLDEVHFPQGYGEEDDYCLRAQDAGFLLAVADDAYVFHAKSASFSHERRRRLAAEGTTLLKRKHGSRRIHQLTRELHENAVLAQMRERIRQRLLQSMERVA